MLAKSVVDEFLSREMRSYDWLKDLSHGELDEELGNLNPVPYFYSPDLYKHQKVAFLIGAYKKYFLFFLDPGLGKSRLSLDLIAYHKQLGNVHEPVLILVPKVANMADWASNVEAFRPDLTFERLVGSSKQRLDHLEKTTADVLVLNYDGLVSMVSVKANKGRKKKMAVDRAFADEVLSMFDGVIFDESTLLKNHQSLTFQACGILSKWATIRYGLTGTPFGSDPTDLWAQFYAVDHGETLAPTISIFREAFCTKHKNRFSGGYDWQFDNRKRNKLSRMIKNRSILYREEEVGDMPEKVYIERRVPMTGEVSNYYKDIREKIKENKRNYREVENNFIRLRMLSSGFIGLVDEDDGERLEVELKSNPKLDELEQLLSEIPQGEKVAVVHVYVHTGKMIWKRLNRMKLDYAHLDGSTPDPDNQRERFVNDPQCNVLTVNAATGSLGLNLQVSHYCLLVESPISVIDRQQMEKRFHRAGQVSDRVFYYDFVMEGSIDQRVLSNLQEGRDLVKDILDDPGQL